MKKFTMKDRIIKYLEDYGSITSWEAIQELGCTRLSEYIRQLRLEYDIEDKWLLRRNRYGEPVKYKQYILSNHIPNLDLPFWKLDIDKRNEMCYNKNVNERRN